MRLGVPSPLSDRAQSGRQDLNLRWPAPKAGGLSRYPTSCPALLAWTGDRRDAPARGSPGAAIFVIGAPLYRHRVLARGTVAAAEPAFEYYADRFNEVMHVASTVPRSPQPSRPTRRAELAAVPRTNEGFRIIKPAARPAVPKNSLRSGAAWRAELSEISLSVIVHLRFANSVPDCRASSR